MNNICLSSRHFTDFPKAGWNVGNKNYNKSRGSDDKHGGRLIWENLFCVVNDPEAFEKDTRADSCPHDSVFHTGGERMFTFDLKCWGKQRREEFTDWRWSYTNCSNWPQSSQETLKCHRESTMMEIFQSRCLNMYGLSRSVKGLDRSTDHTVSETACKDLRHELAVCRVKCELAVNTDWEEPAPFLRASDRLMAVNQTLPFKSVARCSCVLCAKLQKADKRLKLLIKSAAQERKR